MTQTLLVPPDLCTADRCDRCGAQAFYRALFANGELMFCAHHGREYSPRLVEIALELQDGTADIDRRPNAAAY